MTVPVSVAVPCVYLVLVASGGSTALTLKLTTKTHQLRPTQTNTDSGDDSSATTVVAAGEVTDEFTNLSHPHPHPHPIPTPNTNTQCQHTTNRHHHGLRVRETATVVAVVVTDVFTASPPPTVAVAMVRWGLKQRHRGRERGRGGGGSTKRMTNQIEAQQHETVNRWAAGGGEVDGDGGGR